ncbi:unnamed protein product, partial [Didymodactylos carnosus]
MNANGHRPIETCVLYDDKPYSVLQTFLKLTQVTSDIFFNQKLNKSLLKFAKEQNRSHAAKIIEQELNLRLWNSIAQIRDDKNEKARATAKSETEKLINYGAQIDYKHSNEDYNEWTVLHLACKSSNNLDFIKYLIENLKAKYTLPNGNGDYPISIASEYGQLSVVQYLHSLPETQLNVANKDRQTPLHLATKNYHLLIVRYLVLWGADHQAQNTSKQTPLDIALSNKTTQSKDEDINNKKLVHF